MGNFNNFFGDTFGAYSILEAAGKIADASKEFYSNGGGCVEIECPKCKAKYIIDCYNAEKDEIIKTGIIECKECNCYIGYDIMGNENIGNYIYLKVYDSRHALDSEKELDKYLAENVPVEDWAVIFRNNKIGKTPQAQRVKAILESKGHVFK